MGAELLGELPPSAGFALSAAIVAIVSTSYEEDVHQTDYEVAGCVQLGALFLFLVAFLQNHFVNTIGPVRFESFATPWNGQRF